MMDTTTGNINIHTPNSPGQDDATTPRVQAELTTDVSGQLESFTNLLKNLTQDINILNQNVNLMNTQQQRFQAEISEQVTTINLDINQKVKTYPQG